MYSDTKYRMIRKIGAQIRYKGPPIQDRKVLSDEALKVWIVWLSGFFIDS